MADISITISIPRAGLNGGLGGANAFNNDKGIGNQGLAGGAPSQGQDKLLQALSVVLSALLPGLANHGGGQGTAGQPLGRSSDALGAQGNGGVDGGPGGGLTNSPGAGGSSGQNSLEGLLTKLMDILMPNAGQSGQGLQNSANGGLAGAQGSGGTAGTGASSGLEDLSKSLLQDSGESALGNGISPTKDGGGQISDNPLLKILLALIAMMMENQKSQFGQPQEGNGGNSGGGAPAIGGGNSGGGAPAIGGGNSGGGAPAIGGGNSGGGAPAIGGGNSGGGAPAIGGGNSGGGAPAIGGGNSGGGAPAIGGGNSGGGAPAIGGGNSGGGAPAIGGGTVTPSREASTATGAGGTSKAGAVSFPVADNANAIVVNTPIKVGPGEVFDGKGKTYVAGPGLGDGSQKEGQKPLFEVANGGSVKNVILGNNAADGIHLHGDAKIDNVHWTNVGEDALTVKSNTGGKPANVTITNSSAQGASDKVFQLNADANFTVDNFKVKDFGTFVRTNGGQQGNWNLNLSNIDAQNGKFSFVKSDSEGLNVNVKNANLDNVNNHYKVPKSTHLQVS
ncbi:pectate lyase [Dickeya lacustris]|uniref:pectate lyase n=1 Tax=Dickeya lacustris TaxID=2259638 RepID=A0ABY8G7R3_9GAMM|nr:pectate lyase [Dickeya lacustris]WFN55950.1 pectate lyase [Dickeya lacustris]